MAHRGLLRKKGKDSDVVAMWHDYANTGAQEPIVIKGIGEKTKKN